MQKKIVQAIIFLILIFAIFVALNTLTNAQEVLRKTDLIYFALAGIFFLLSIFFWLIAWSHLIRKHSKAETFGCTQTSFALSSRISFRRLLLIGFSALYGSLTPVQLGAEALRSLLLKKHFDVDYNSSISASMVAKGTKFLVIALLSVFVILFAVSNYSFPPLISFGLGTGFMVIFIATLLFLLPLKKEYGLIIANFFGFFSLQIKPFAKLRDFFQYYSTYLQGMRKRTYLVVLFFTLVSFLFEFLALQYSFFALSISLSLGAVFVLLILISILERTPFLPRGIGVVELVGASFLALPFWTESVLTLPQIGAVLILFGVVRLIIPTFFSFLVSAIPKHNS